MPVKETALYALRLMLRPVLRFCLLQSVKHQEISEVIKSVLLQIAEEEAKRRRVAVSDSRLSVMTGLHRRDVARLGAGHKPGRDRGDIVTRVIGNWQQLRRFRTKSGRPRTLEIEGKDSEFVDLVRTVSQDVNPYTVLFEIERVGAVERTNQGLRLRKRLFIPKGDFKAGVELLGHDMEDLVSAVQENITQEPDIPNLHIKTEYDNIPRCAVEEIRRWFIREGSAFHQRARNYLSQFDRDLSASNSRQRSSEDRDRVRVAVGTFSRIDDDAISENTDD